MSKLDARCQSRAANRALPIARCQSRAANRALPIARCQSRAWDRMRALNIQFLELSLVLGCILFIKLVRATNRACELSWARLTERPG